MTDFELLLVEDKGKFWNIVGVTYATALIPSSNLKTLRASMLSIEKAKTLLKEGKKIFAPKETRFSELQPDEIFENDLNELERVKQKAINDICAKMHQSIIGVSVIDAMNYLNNYLKLLNAGYYITDDNRDDKYFEIIEKSQLAEEPSPLGENSSFEDEQKYLSEKKEYDIAQRNLSILEKYLNAYDKLSNIQHVTNLLNDTKAKVIDAKSEKEIDDIMTEYQNEIGKFSLS